MNYQGMDSPNIPPALLAPTIDSSLPIPKIDLELSPGIRRDVTVPWTLQESMAELRRTSYEIRDTVSADLVSDTSTEKNYRRYIDSYDSWWFGNEEAKRLDKPTYVCIPSRPIAATKVAHFLNYELRRPKASF